jgi:hypothetical protein
VGSLYKLLLHQYVSSFFYTLKGVLFEDAVNNCYSFLTCIFRPKTNAYEVGHAWTSPCSIPILPPKKGMGREGLGGERETENSKVVSVPNSLRIMP